MSKKSKQERRIKAVSQLENMRIILENPCHTHWGEMKGNDRTRECSICQLTVYNFLGLSQAEILDLIKLHEGKLCAQAYVRSDGITLESCSTRAENLKLARGG